MKNTSSLCLLVISLLFSRCSLDTNLSPKNNQPQKIDYDKLSADLMGELAPQVVGRWTLQQVYIKSQSYNYDQKQLKLTRDTVFQNLATLTVRPASRLRISPADPGHPEFEGTIEFRTKTYPVYFYLRANPERLVNAQGPQAFFNFDYAFPNGTRIPEAEETFLDNLGLVGEVFSLETVSKQPKMVWRGLNRGIDRIELQKQ